MVNITVEDILGPLGKDGEPTECLSLLHYSINLNPALRRQIQADVVGYMSQSELKLVPDEASAGARKVMEALPKQSIMRKQALLRDRTPMPREDRHFLEQRMLSSTISARKKPLPRDQSRFDEEMESAISSTSVDSALRSRRAKPRSGASAGKRS